MFLINSQHNADGLRKIKVWDARKLSLVDNGNMDIY